jgi:hypothetical protein
MTNHWNRRQVLKQLVGASTVLILPRTGHSERTPAVGPNCEIQIASVSANTVRLSFLPIENGRVSAIPFNGSLVQESWGAPLAKLRGDWRTQTVNLGELRIVASSDPLAFTIETAKGERVQFIAVDRQTGVVSFDTGDGPLLGLGEGGPQFDRRGSRDLMRSGQGGYELATHGGRVPMPWIIGTAG